MNHGHLYSENCTLVNVRWLRAEERENVSAMLDAIPNTGPTTAALVLVLLLYCCCWIYCGHTDPVPNSPFRGLGDSPGGVGRRPGPVPWLLVPGPVAGVERLRADRRDSD
jgi:hypothetical protein